MSLTEVVGAAMRHRSLSMWTDQAPWIVPKDYHNPSPAEIRRKCRIDDWPNVQQRVVYGCHDIVPVKISPEGTLSALTAVRTDQDAPIPGFRWMVGGRILPFDKCAVYDTEYSVLIKLQDELGVLPSAVRALYPLGVGETQFDAVMTYRSNDGSESVSHNLGRRISTLNLNFVASVDPSLNIAECLPAGRDLLDPLWVSENDLNQDLGCCEYMLELLRHVFRCWRKQPLPTC